MKIAIVLIGGMMLAAGCSKGDEAPSTDGKSLDAAAATISATGAGGGNQSAPDGSMRDGSMRDGSMRADVSTLAADTSGLNVRVTEMGTIIDLPADALFDFDKSTLTSVAEVELGKAAELIRRSPPGAIQVIGYTDNKGDDAYNQKLSEARAKKVAEWFGKQVGVRQREFQISGKGETDPIAPNEMAGGADDPAGRAKNRRVEVVLPTASPPS